MVSFPYMISPTALALFQFPSDLRLIIRASVGMMDLLVLFGVVLTLFLLNMPVFVFSNKRLLFLLSGLAFQTLSLPFPVFLFVIGSNTIKIRDS